MIKLMILIFVIIYKECYFSVRNLEISIDIIEKKAYNS